MMTGPKLAHRFKNNEHEQNRMNPKSPSIPFQSLSFNFKTRHDINPIQNSKQNLDLTFDSKIILSKHETQHERKSSKHTKHPLNINHTQAYSMKKDYIPAVLL